MNDANTGYKIIALLTVAFAIYSCTSPAIPQSDRSAGGGIEQLQASIASLQTQVETLSAEIKGCPTQDFVDGKCSELPKGAGMTATFCRNQGSGLQLGAAYEIDNKVKADFGAGWPEVVWGDILAQIKVPATYLPSKLSGAGSATIGRNINVCVNVPMAPTATQESQLKDLVKGVNVQSGSQAKYMRRADRVLNYAARRTPIATANKASFGAFKPIFAATATATTSPESDDAFDVADNAVAEFMADGFQPTNRAAGVLADPIFQDLAQSLDLPQQLKTLIADPQQVFDSLKQVTKTTACASYGIDATLRSRHPVADDLCNRIEALPGDAEVRAVASRVYGTAVRVNSMLTGTGLRNFICNNVSLRVLFNDCSTYRLQF